MSALTLEQAAVALARCDKTEQGILVQATAHEQALMLEAKYFAEAKIRDLDTTHSAQSAGATL